MARIAQDPRLKDEALFNIARSALEDLSRGGKDNQTIRKDAREAFAVFVQHHAKSYLSDDATMYMVRLDVSQGREGDALMECRQMLSRYPAGDAAKRMRYVIRKAVYDSLGSDSQVDAID